MGSPTIPLTLLFQDLEWDRFKIHVAQANYKGVRPLDVFIRSFDEWQNDWNGRYQRKNYWNREFIFSIIEMPHKPDKWLFGGIFKVISNRASPTEDSPARRLYEVEFNPTGESLIGRLIVGWKKDSRPMGRSPEHPSMLPKMTVSEILPEAYAGEDCPGYANINHPFPVIEKVWRENKPDWKAALENSRGVYLITDTKTGLRYVGSAYGDTGLWARWGAYFKTHGHGNNKLLKELIRKNGKDYARAHFTISLLEHASSRDSEQQTIEREEFWKRTLMTVGPFGLNDVRSSNDQLHH